MDDIERQLADVNSDITHHYERCRELCERRDNLLRRVVLMPDGVAILPHSQADEEACGAMMDMQRPDRFEME